MPKQFARTLLTGFLVTLLIFGGINMVSAAKPTPTPPPGPTATPAPATPMQIFGAWHCGNHYCDWSLVRDMTEFDQANHWLIDRGDGRPSVNLVVLSFVNPLKMLNRTDTGLNGMIPAGMTQDVVDYFKSRGIRVMLSIGGITYTTVYAAYAKVSNSAGGSFHPFNWGHGANPGVAAPGDDPSGFSIGMIYDF